METYLVRYKRQDQWFWRKIRNVIEDGVVKPDISSISFRFFLTNKKILIEIPIQNTMFKFSSERAGIISVTEQSGSKKGD